MRIRSRADEDFQPFNRTSVELKRFSLGANRDSVNLIPFNRTSVELKHVD